jgi:hypothetical protein
MKNETIKNTAVCRENDEAFNEKWFSHKRAQFIRHVDTLYFMVKPDIECLRKSEPWGKFIHTLQNAKERAEAVRDRITVFENVFPGLETVPFKGAQLYSLHFGLQDNFDIFTSSATPNENTPPIWVQIRSNALWLEGLKGAFDAAYDCIECVLGKFSINIRSIQENRIRPSETQAYHRRGVTEEKHI